MAVFGGESGLRKGLQDGKKITAYYMLMGMIHG